MKIYTILVGSLCWAMRPEDDGGWTTVGKSGKKPPVFRRKLDEFALGAYPHKVGDTYEPRLWVKEDLDSLDLSLNYGLVDLECEIEGNSFVNSAMRILGLGPLGSEELDVDAIKNAWMFATSVEQSNAKRFLPRVAIEFGCPKRNIAVDYFVEFETMKEFRRKLNTQNLGSMLEYLRRINDDLWVCTLIEAAWQYIVYEDLKKLDAELERLIIEGSDITVDDILYTEELNPAALTALAISQNELRSRQINHLELPMFDQFVRRIKISCQPDSPEAVWLMETAKELTPGLLKELFNTAGVPYKHRIQPSPSKCIPRIGWSLVYLQDYVKKNMEFLRDRLEDRISTTLQRELAREIPI